MTGNRVALLDDFRQGHRELLPLSAARASVHPIRALGTRHQRQNVRVRENTWQKISMGIGGKDVVLLLHPSNHGAHDMAKQRRYALELFFHDVCCNDGQLTEAKGFCGVRSRLGRQQ